MNCIIYENRSNDRLYIGTDVGVYYRDSISPAWLSYFSGLPRVDVEELEIAYGIGKIRAATNGRGLWESDLAGLISTEIKVIEDNFPISIVPNPNNGKFKLETGNIKPEMITIFL